MIKWWMRATGTMYLMKFVAVTLVKAPIRTQAPDGLALAASGNPVARFLVDTWVIFGLEMAALGVALWVASWRAERAAPLVVAILGVEVSGIVADVYQLARGHDFHVPGVWIAIHSVVAVSGWVALRAQGASTERAPMASPRVQE